MAAQLKSPNVTFARHRTSLVLWRISIVDNPVASVTGWRSAWSCTQRASATQPPSCKCRAAAPPYVPPTWSVGVECEDVMARLRETEQLRNCLGSPLTADEQRSLVKCLDSAQLGVDTCLVDGLPALRSHLLDYIGAVAYTQTDDLELVEGAMLLIEQLSLALGPEASDTPALATGRFSGQWQMLVTTAGGWPGGRLQYVPVIELLEISEDGQHFRLETQAGPLYTQAEGDVTWVQQPLHLHYHVKEFRVEMFRKSLSLPPPVAENDLCVFALTQGSAGEETEAGVGTALARSSAGGITLMVRPT